MEYVNLTEFEPTIGDTCAVSNDPYTRRRMNLEELLRGKIYPLDGLEEFVATKLGELPEDPTDYTEFEEMEREALLDPAVATNYFQAEQRAAEIGATLDAEGLTLPIAEG